MDTSHTMVALEVGMENEGCMEFAEFLVILLGLCNGLKVDSYGGVHLDGTESGQCIGCCIVFTFDMSNVGSELRNIIKVANLSAALAEHRHRTT